MIDQYWFALIGLLGAIGWAASYHNCKRAENWERLCNKARNGWDSCIEDLKHAHRFNAELHNQNMELRKMLDAPGEGDEWKHSN